MRKRILFILLVIATCAHAQVGDHRNRFSVGGSGGYVLNTINFSPSVQETMYGGMTVGATGRYTCEKYFKTLCAVQLEINFTMLGWKEKIQDLSGNPVINAESGEAESYKRNLTYIQIPFLAHLSWGKENKGLSFFVNAGPQIGFLISDQTSKNYTSPAMDMRASSIVKQESMPVENTIDYGIAAGGGIELHINHIGRISLDARYYYGLGNIYGDSKKDYFGTSNHNSIFIKLGYLFDITK